MHLGIDVREACRSQRTGKGQWTYAFVTEFLSRNIPCTLYTDTNLPDEWESALHCKTVKIHARGLRWHFLVARHVRSDKALTGYLSPTSYLVPWLLGSRVRTYPVVHDIIAFRNEPHDWRATLIERLTLARVLKHATHIFTVSDATKSDILQRFSFAEQHAITPVYAASMMKSPFPHKSDKIVLCIGTLCPRKNQKRLIEAHASLPDNLRKQFPLVLVGKRGWHDADIVQRASSTEHVSWRNYVSDKECLDLYAQASVFAFPSLYEGFGMPILDAFAACVPVLTSNKGSLAEVVGDAGCVIDPLSSQSIRDGLHTVLTNTELRESYVRKGNARLTQFSWAKSVDALLKVINH